MLPAPCALLLLLLLTAPLAHAAVRASPPLGAQDRSGSFIPVAGTEPGASATFRRNVLLAGVLFTIVATGAALLLPPRRPVLVVVVVGALVVLTIVAINAWRVRQPPAPPGTTGTTAKSFDPLPTTS